MTRKSPIIFEDESEGSINLHWDLNNHLNISDAKKTSDETDKDAIYIKGMDFDQLKNSLTEHDIYLHFKKNNDSIDSAKKISNSQIDQNLISG